MEKEKKSTQKRYGFLYKDNGYGKKNPSLPYEKKLKEPSKNLIF